MYVVRAWIVGVLGLAIVLGGCIDGVLPGGTEFRRAVKVDLDESFSPEDSLNPDDPGRLSKQQDVSFQVGEAERDLSIRIDVQFEQDSPVPMTPSGNVSVNLTDPTDQVYRWTYPESRSSETTIQEPAAGTWNLHVEAQGQGSYRIVMQTRAPAG